jgi:hypothetical protein
MKGGSSKMDIILETEVCYNNKEDDIAQELGISEVSGSHLFVIENCRKKERKNLTDELAETIQEEVAVKKSKYPEKIVLNIIQFKKGITKTDEQIESAIKCNLFEGSDGVCLYENNPLASVEELGNKLPALIEKSEGYEIYFVIEMDGEEVLEKITLLLETGIRNFILVAGSYSNDNLWRQVIVSSILREEGKAIVLLPARMNTKTKKSFINHAMNYGATIVVHGIPFGGGSSETKFLDRTDMLYKIKDLLPETHSIKTNIVFSDLANTFLTNSRGEREFSKICSLTEARLFCEANRRQITIDT